MEAWAEAIASRLTFFGQEVRAEAPALHPFLHACLGLLEQEAAQQDLAPVRAALGTLCAMAREAIDGTCDDRAVNAAAAPWREHPGPAGWAAAIPGRVIWLADMVAQLPGEQGAAAVMLVNDLAAVQDRLPLRAWSAALDAQAM